MKYIAIIPARGGSKRLPKKNIANINGVPLILYSIDEAKKAHNISRIIVSSDSDDIIKISENRGAEVVKRDPSLASDTSTVLDVCIDFVKRNLEESEYATTVLVVLYPTSPLRSVEDIESVMDLIDDKCCFSMAVTKYFYPPHQALIKDSNKNAKALFPEYVDKRCSDFGSIVVDNGSTYAVRVDKLLKHRTFYGPDLKVHMMPKLRSIDVNDADDFTLLTSLMKQQ